MFRRHRRPLITALAVTSVALLALTGCAPRGGAATPEAADEGPIVIRGSWPLSGPLSAIGQAASGATAYFDAVNADGGIDGRQIDFAALDDAYDPARLVSNNKEFVEQDKAIAVVNFGGITIPARPPVNEAGVAQIVQAGNTPMSDVEGFPYTRAFWPDATWEGQLQGEYIAENFPDATVGYVGFNNDLTDSQVAGLEAGGVELAKVITLPPGQADVSSQVTELQAAGVDVLVVTIGAPTMGALLSYLGQIDYHPAVFVGSTAADAQTSVLPAGPENVKGAYAFQWFKDPLDPAFAEEETMQQFRDDLEEYSPGTEPNALSLHGYGIAAAIVTTLREADEISSDGFLASWDSLSGAENPMLVDGATLNAGPGGRLVYEYQLKQFDGETWVALDDPVSVVDAGIAK
jgi:ABC-type branched-subunit amino acid transport system substrate-binding protein